VTKGGSTTALDLLKRLVSTCQMGRKRAVSVLEAGKTSIEASIIIQVSGVEVRESVEASIDVRIEASSDSSKQAKKESKQASRQPSKGPST
jgi:hypothetical protein